MSEESEEWASYRRQVLDGLASSAGKLDKLDAKINDFQVELAVLRVKAGVWGLLGGMVPVAVMIAVQFFTRAR